MHKIHSFLHGKLKNYNICIVVAVIVLAAIIMAFNFDSSYGAKEKTNATYVKDQYGKSALSKAEETAGAKIRSDEVLTRIKFNFEQTIERTKRIESTQKKRENLNIAIRKQKLKMKEEIKTALRSPQQKKAVLKSKIKVGERKLSKQDRKVLERIVEAEAEGEDTKGKMLVACVILNRANSGRFPRSVTDVVFQKNGHTCQFSPIKDGRYWSVTVSKETKRAVKRVLEGEDDSKGALYFSARSKADKGSMSWFDKNLTWLFKYGAHEFYK